MAKSAAGENAWLWCTQRFGQNEMESAAELFLNAFFFYHECKKKETQSAINMICPAVRPRGRPRSLRGVPPVASPARRWPTASRRPCRTSSPPPPAATYRSAAAISPCPDARYAQRCDLGPVALALLGLQRLPQHCHLSRPLLRDDQCRRPDQAVAVGDGTSHIYQSALSSPQGVASSKQSTTPPPAGEHSLDGHLACTAMPLPGHAVAGPCFCRTGRACAS